MNSIQATMPMPAAGADRPSPLQGETDSRPSPEPPANNASDKAAAITAPANTAAQETAETADSRTAGAPSRARPPDIAFSMVVPCSVRARRLPARIQAVLQCQNSASRMMMGMGTPNSHSRMERIQASFARAK
ncbi:hypothetical protein [Achromobacter ruhlandii]|uniref:hypothetical protein n=1 Tax=Achromobacter ruhlandii TaxID=72557 RepID=UPI00387E4270